MNRVAPHVAHERDAETRHFLRNTGSATMKVIFLFAVDQFSDVEYQFGE